MNGNNKVLITGAGGLLGTELKKQFGNNLLLTPARDEFNLSDRSQVKEYISQHKPSLIIHAAAHTNVEAAETNPQETWQINTGSVHAICESIISTSTRLIFISSTGIYGHGKQTPWNEFDVPVPTTVHHKSKYAAEQIIRNHIKDHLILRTGWLFGGTINNPKNFVLNRYKEANGKELVYANSRQFGNPTSAKDLAKQIHLLAEQKTIGTFNAVNSGVVSRLEYIREIFSAFQLTTKAMEQQGKFNRLADVSDNESAENFSLNLLGLNIMGDFRNSLHEYVNELKQDLINKTT